MASTAREACCGSTGSSQLPSPPALSLLPLSTFSRTVWAFGPCPLGQPCLLLTCLRRLEPGPALGSWLQGLCLPGCSISSQVSLAAGPGTPPLSPQDKCLLVAVGGRSLEGPGVRGYCLGSALPSPEPSLPSVCSGLGTLCLVPQQRLLRSQVSEQGLGRSLVIRLF